LKQANTPSVSSGKFIASGISIEDFKEFAGDFNDPEGFINNLSDFSSYCRDHQSLESCSKFYQIKLILLQKNGSLLRGVNYFFYSSEVERQKGIAEYQQGPNKDFDSSHILLSEFYSTVQDETIRQSIIDSYAIDLEKYILDLFS